MDGVVLEGGFPIDLASVALLDCALEVSIDPRPPYNASGKSFHSGDARVSNV